MSVLLTTLGKKGLVFWGVCFLLLGESECFVFGFDCLLEVVFNSPVDVGP